MVSCIAPASVAARAHTSQRIIDVVIGALAPALPEVTVGAANGANSMAVFAGIDPETNQPYVYLETLGGGFGGRNDRDGKDGVQVHITNTSNLPIEAIEMEYPLLVERYGLVKDSGGAGRYRGGLGLERAVRPIGHTCTFNGVGERFRNPPWGVFGGGSGKTGSFWVENDHAEPIQLLNKQPDMPLSSDQVLVVNTPGAGGTRIRRIPSTIAMAAANRGPLPPKANSTYSRGSRPRSLDTDLIARIMLAEAIS